MKALPKGLLALTGDEEGKLCRLIEAGQLPDAKAHVEQLTGAFERGNICVEVQCHLRRGEDFVNGRLFELAATMGLPTVATNGVLYATAQNRAVLDVCTCAREHTHLDVAGRKLSATLARFPLRILFVARSTRIPGMAE